MQQLHNFTEQLSRWLAWLAGGIILFGCAIPISIDVATRAIFGRTVLESFEISGYALAACIGLGLGYTVTTKANIRVDILTARLPRKIRIIADLMASIALAITALAIAWYSFSVLEQSWKLGAKSQSTLQVPLLLPQSIWWIGFAWFATVATLTPVLAIAKLLTGGIDEAEELISNPDLAEEMDQIGFDSKGQNT